MTDTLKCQYCGTTTTKSGQPFKNGSALWTHENVHCSQRPGKQQPQETGGGGCQHAWQLLSSRDPAQARAIAAGYRKVCTECMEVV